MKNKIKIRDLRKSDQYKIDDVYISQYARLCGVYATAVYNSLSRHSNFQTQECFPSMDTIAEQHGIIKNTVLKGIKKLEEYGIIYIEKKKDNKTKRQKPNVYTLMDKSQWKESRVHEMHPEPSAYDDKSRVHEMHCKDNKGIKDNKYSNAKDVAELIHAFQWNIAHKQWYGNTTQRKACQTLLEHYTLEQLVPLIESLPDINEKEYAPSITTPKQLLDKWSTLEAFVKKQKTNTFLI